MSRDPHNVQQVLTGQVAIVTGGGRGIGWAIAQALAQQGAAVTVTARSGAQLADTVALIAAAGGQALALTADVTDLDAVAHVVAETEHQLGPVDPSSIMRGWWVPSGHSGRWSQQSGGTP